MSSNLVAWQVGGPIDQTEDQRPEKLLKPENGWRLNVHYVSQVAYELPLMSYERREL